MKARLDYIMNKFIDCGFEFLKIDFLNYAALEGNHRDPAVKTGMQAYNQALKMFTDYVDTDKFFLSYSIAPLFPYQYAHARRISCDTADDIGETVIYAKFYKLWLVGGQYFVSVYRSGSY